MDYGSPGAIPHASSIWVLTIPDPLQQLHAPLNHVTQHALTRRVATAQSVAALGDPTVGLIICATILRAIDPENPVAPETAAVLTKATPVGVMPSGELEEWVLHLNTFNIAYSSGGNVHMSAGVDAVSQGSSAHACTMNIVQTLGHPDAVPGMTPIEIAGPAGVR